ncbi:unnamed protein product [Adineta steineri]|uniref:NAD(P)(+)--arginine ADP-ribosyltransferase n=1 Tax=Adineta steineri TaxID=433720 RepID=A0A814D5E4_9BILA|nr:unnamed protein product [Adineta steineri]CAF0949646.1 unnamed protein product [Adineta steineri]
MSESGSNQKASLLSNPFMNNNNTTMTTSDTIQPRRRIAQDYSLLWLDESMEEANKDYQDIWTQLKTLTDNVNVFTQRDVCIDYLTDAQEEVKYFLIVKDTMCQQIMPLINDIPQLHGIYISNDTKILPEEWTKKWQKIKNVHANIDNLCQGLQLGIKQYHQDSIAMSFITPNEMTSTDNLNQLEPTFMYTQIFKDILLDMQHSQQDISQFIAYCRHHGCVSPINIDRFEKEYHDQLAIWWYTFPSNIYSMLNYGLRTLDADAIVTMGFFICHLHQQIQQLHEQQVNSYGRKPFVVYRGQGLMKSDFEKLQKTKGGLLSFNNFLSTSTNKEVSLGFAQCASTKLDTTGILFIMSIDPSIQSAPFASIKEESYFKEEDEILFSMHTVFRVNAIQHTNNNNQLYQVNLELTSDDDQQLRLLTDRIRQEAVGDSGWERLGRLLLKIGQFNKAEELYNVLLEQTSNEGKKALYYNQLGSVHYNQGDYQKAIQYLEQKLETEQKTLPSNHLHFATSYANIGTVYMEMREYSKALSFLEKALDIQQKALPSNHPNLAVANNNIAGVYDSRGEYSKALSFYKKALEIQQKTLSSYHPALATSYNNIGMPYNNMREYSKALSFFEKALEIRQKTLPSNHPDLAGSYNNIGLVYHNTEEYMRALSFFEKALEIREKTLPSNHPDLASSYNNIGSVYNKMREYSKAVSSYEKALDVEDKTLPPNHPDLASSYNNIGMLYNDIAEYSKALSFLEKALEIYQKIHPSNNPDLATLSNNIGSVYNKMEEYSKAIPFLEKALEVYQKIHPSNHPHLGTICNNIGSVYDKMGEYSKALSFLEKALEIQEETLPSNHCDLATSYNNIALEIRKETVPSNHPDLASSYNNIGSVYNCKGEYSKALSFFEKDLEICQKTLAEDHPDLAALYNNIGMLYINMREYSKALSFLEKALEICQKSLPSTHPDLATSYNNIGSVCDNMKDYSKALSYFERALDIFQRVLPSTHSYIKSVKRSIESVKKEIIENIQ